MAARFANLQTHREGVGHRHKLTKLVEESNNLISKPVATLTWDA
ncbi:hypothetical protein IMSAGC016_01090 [Muribaculaceae bacterium]|nr:hypothetical protein IMSAGC016_01090 [Muribaculaceae bacterium]